MPSPKINKQKRPSYQSHGEASPQSPNSDLYTPQKPMKKELKLKNKNEFIPQGYQTPSQESYFPSYQETNPRPDVIAC